MSKILFFDVDGTLYNSEKKLPSSTKEAIVEARNNGYEIAIATGRAPFMISAILEELEIDTYVAFNGQYVVCGGEVIFTDSIPVPQLEEIMEFGQKNNHPFVFIDDKQMISSVENNPFIEVSINSLKYPYPRLDPYYYRDHEVYQTLIFLEEKDEAIYRETFGQVNFVRWHKYSCDILPKEGSKARGIYKVLEKLDISVENTYAFGDGLNDIEMMKAVGTSVAMGNGHEKVKALADIVTDHVNNDGLAKAMKKLNII